MLRDEATIDTNNAIVLKRFGHSPSTVIDSTRTQVQAGLIDEGPPCDPNASKRRFEVVITLCVATDGDPTMYRPSLICNTIVPVVIGALLLSACGPARAVVTGVEFVPADPVSNEPVRVAVQFLGCPLAPFPNVDGESFDIRVDGATIDFFYSFDVAAPCGVPPAVPPITFDLGFFPPGDYTLRIAGLGSDTSFPPSMDGLDPRVEEFSVGEPVFVPIPAVSAWSLALLAGLLAGLAVFRLRL